VQGLRVAARLLDSFVVNVPGNNPTLMFRSAKKPRQARDDVIRGDRIAIDQLGQRVERVEQKMRFELRPQCVESRLNNALLALMIAGPCVEGGDTRDHGRIDD
jgi:hypothetical protein